MADLRPVPQPAPEQSHRTRAADCQRLAVAPRRHAVAIARYASQTVEKGEIALLLGQQRNEVGEGRDNGLADTPAVTVAGAEQHGIANKCTIIGMVTAQPEHRFGDDEPDIVLQPLPQAVAPMIIAVGVARPPAHPHGSVVPQFHRGGRDVIGPEIERPAARQVEAGMMPVAGQNAVLDRTAVKREAEMRAAVIERVDASLIMYDQQWARPAARDGHTLGLQLLQSCDVDPAVGFGLDRRLTPGLEHRASVHHYSRR